MPENQDNPNVTAAEKARSELHAAIGRLTMEIEPAFTYHLDPHPLSEDKPEGEEA
jgi:hypothetical protein